MTAAEVAHALGGAQRTGNGWVCRCPVPSHGKGRGDLTASLSLADGDDGRLLLTCFAQCDPLDVLDALRRRGLLDDRRADRDAPPANTFRNRKRSDEASRRLYALRLWGEAQPIPGTLAETYLARRGLDVSGLDLAHAIRWHDGIGAMVAAMTDPLTGEHCGTHRTFLAPDASKRERKMIGRAGVVRISPDEDVTLGLGLSEGVEDALSVRLDGWSPVWAATSAGGIARFPLLTGIEAITLFSDSDDVGRKAAMECATRWRQAGREAHIVVPGGTP